jgi:predicted AAA+ superfamily ATPase
MRDDELRSWLRQRNPWWRSRTDPLAWTQQDATLRGAAEQRIDYQPDVLQGVRSGGLYVVRGPRRVGKSVALKRFAAELLGTPDVEAGQVIYLSLDEFDQRGLRRALHLARALTAHVGNRRRYWLIDEITAVSGWPAVIKAARDDTSVAFDTVVLTGSSAQGLDEARRSLGAGRVGPAKDPFRVLLPMTFRDFVRATGCDLPEVPAFGVSLSQSRDTADVLRDLSPFVDDFDLAWQDYCEVGGFPRAVSEHHRDGAVSPAFATDIHDWLAPDVTPGDAPESVLRLLSELGSRMSSPLNHRRTAETVGLTRERLNTRINRLSSTFATLSCPRVDDRGTPVPGSQRKVYLLDPLLGQLPGLIEPGFPIPDMTVVGEAALAVAASRAMEAVHPGRLLEGRAVGYARTATGEIDFAPLPIRVSGQDATTTPIESKWVSNGWRPGARAIEAKYGRGFVATKNILDTEHKAWAVPAGLLTMLLG